jgi:hypothetical protein
MKRKINPPLFVWIPFGLQSGVPFKGNSWILGALVILGLWIILEKLFSSHR